jgi:hypothetical protein
VCWDRFVAILQCWDGAPTGGAAGGQRCAGLTGWKMEGVYRTWKIRSYSSACLWRQSRDSQEGYGSKNREKCIQLGCVRCSEVALIAPGLHPHPLPRWDSAIMTPKRSLCYQMRLNWSDDSGSVRLRFSAGEGI